MKDLNNPNWIMIKGALFLVFGLLSGGLLLLDKPSLKLRLCL